jgi:hypothetical protein
LLTSTVSWPELIWTVAAAVGLVFNSISLIRAAADLIVLRIKKINSIREYAAMTTMCAYASWTLTQLIFVLIGVHAMSRPPVSAESSRQLFPLICFLFISAILAGTSIFIERRRVRLLMKIREIENVA